MNQIKQLCRMTAGNKRGSVTVFICIFFVALAAMILTFVDVSKKEAVSASADTLCNLWGESILAEYDLNLKNRYNLFGFYGYPSDVKKKLDFYAGESFEKKRYITYEVQTCNLYDYSLVHVDLMREQLAEAGKLAFTEKFIKPSKQVEAIEGTIQRGGDIFADLPSKGSAKSFSMGTVAEWLKSGSSGEILETAGKSWLIHQYLFSYFKDAADDRDLGTTYLQKEIEYIISGKRSDSANQKDIRLKTVLIREGANMLYLMQSPEKKAAALAAAELAAPGAAAVLVQQMILAAWAYAESVNDYKLLLAGHKVPDLKTDETWAMDLDTIMADETQDGYIYTGIDIGRDYQGYLKLFLSALDERVKILRVMDLIQINMRYLYYDSFLLREYNGGLSFVMDVNGKKHEVVKTYDKEF